MQLQGNRAPLWARRRHRRHHPGPLSDHVRPGRAGQALPGGPRRRRSSSKCEAGRHHRGRRELRLRESSREHAPIAHQGGRVSTVVIAKSFARIFYRNAINIGPGRSWSARMPLWTPSPAGHAVSVDADAGAIVDDTTGGARSPWSRSQPFIAQIIAEGGLVNRTRRVLAERQADLLNRCASLHRMSLQCMHPYRKGTMTPWPAPPARSAFCPATASAPRSSPKAVKLLDAVGEAYDVRVLL